MQLELNHNDSSLTTPTESSGGALNVLDLRKSFVLADGSRLEVLKGVSLNVMAGECVAIMGASGSGKSTLLQLLGSLDVPDHGDISLNGVSLSNLRDRKLALLRQKQLGFVFQFHYLLQDLTAVENVALPLLIARRNKRHSFRRAQQLLEDVGLADRVKSPISHLSGGEQQRVALTRALISEPQLLLADEPTGNLDSRISDEIGELITSYTKKTSRIAVIATHNENLARICDRVFILENGRLSSI